MDMRSAISMNHGICPIAGCRTTYRLAVAASIVERFFHLLDAPDFRGTSLDIPLPVSRVLEKVTMSGDDRIRESVVTVARTVWRE
jgi:pyruvate/2-oxoglutarate/acetoin dehydrogenase E1 component